MDSQTQQHGEPPMNSDDALAKVIADGLQFEETPMPGGAASTDPAPTLSTDPVAPPETMVDPPALPQPMVTPPAPADTTAEPELPSVHHSHGTPKGNDKPAADHGAKAGGKFEKLKASALEDLKPLVGKLNLPAEEKFDTLLLIIRSTDDHTLLDEAHAAAKGIEDESKRAQALLDIIKEIDYFSTKR